ncbi:hypothetical protein L6452_14688 [Arctium lappa]|uniref:Uncharacterized protein n=1 Tax=Arctium lappa TaxID=4217 RepID=A0ACB9CM02_ARCLA|nr:hypothetical protein L6452_14688 [Arctium lappa]
MYIGRKVGFEIEGGTKYYKEDTDGFAHFVSSSSTVAAQKQQDNHIISMAIFLDVQVVEDGEQTTLCHPHRISASPPLMHNPDLWWVTGIKRKGFRRNGGDGRR